MINPLSDRYSHFIISFKYIFIEMIKIAKFTILIQIIINVTGRLISELILYWSYKYKTELKSNKKKY